MVETLTVGIQGAQFERIKLIAINAQEEINEVIKDGIYKFLDETMVNDGFDNFSQEPERKNTIGIDIVEEKSLFTKINDISEAYEVPFSRVWSYIFEDIIKSYGMESTNRRDIYKALYGREMKSIMAMDDVITGYWQE